MRERAAQTASVLVIFLVAATKYLAFQPAEERKTRSGSQFGAIHSILAGGEERAAAGGCSCGGGGGLLVFGWTRKQKEGRNRVQAGIETVVPSPWEPLLPAKTL